MSSALARVWLLTPQRTMASAWRIKRREMRDAGIPHTGKHRPAWELHDTPENIAKEALRRMNGFADMPAPHVPPRDEAEAEYSKWFRKNHKRVLRYDLTPGISEPPKDGSP